MTASQLAAFLLSAVWLSAQSPNPGEAKADPWAPLRFLMGTWEAKTGGGSAGAQASGSYLFRLELGGHILARHSSASGCNGPADFDCQHGDLLYVYREAPGGSFKAVYFDNEGHVIHYEVTVPMPNVAVFLSSGSSPGPQFKLVYELKGAVMRGAFQMRMPGRTDFKPYLEWSGQKK